jgi:hypothetical protein
MVVGARVDGDRSAPSQKVYARTHDNQPSISYLIHIYLGPGRKALDGWVFVRVDRKISLLISSYLISRSMISHRTSRPSSRVKNPPTSAFPIW